MLAVLGKILYIPLFHSILTTYILHLLQYWIRIWLFQQNNLSEWISDILQYLQIT
jgi:hypothetical protein